MFLLIYSRKWSSTFYTYLQRYQRFIRNILNRKSCYCCWQYTGRSDSVAAAVGGRIAVLPVYISLSPWNTVDQFWSDQKIDCTEALFYEK